MTPDATPRRTVLLAGAGSVAALTAGCGSDGEEDGGTTASPAPTGTTTPAETSPASSAPVTSAPAGDSLARTSQIPVGGGTVFKERKVVVTQPTAGEFKAFTAVCTHQGCTVGKVENGTINCPCHGSRFRIADGSVAAGPASRPLPEERITVSGDVITLA
ncbi:Rieske 2Fe-2S domain-containing protein [Streptomyces sp. ISL-36]|uniref:Rieske (2Fe-2S) protein n=1 Tax=Streptomyces sp. ISL-36 TaxID=2819182 RepID=UPI001BE58809|nr:Rieske (2Fe-2S) protein [Streptomyces sp. ISL-36]MBT2444007.1 Rieske 2Fe-2S domain-containing protein [Streptomyces sp. ISL-36]